MDVLQVLGTKMQHKNVGGDLLPTDDVNWEEFLNASPDLLSPDIVIEAEDLDQIAIGEDVQTVADTDDAQVEPPLLEEVAAKPEGATAISVQEYSTTSEQNTSFLLTAPQEETSAQPEISISGTLDPSKETSIFSANQPTSPLQGSLKYNFSVSGEAKTLGSTQALQQAAVKTQETATKEIEQPVHGAVSGEIAGSEASTNNARIPAHRADLQEISGQIKNVLPTEPMADGRATAQLVKIDQTRLQDVEVISAEVPRPVGIEAKEAFLMDRLPQNLTGIDPRGVQTDSPVRFSDVGISPISNFQPTMVSPSNSAVAIANAPLRDQPILLQISQAIESAETGKIELRLDPAELGKVRITLSARDGIMHATIMAERPETLDLLRRNSESLDMTFSEQGFGENELSFEQFDQGDQSETPADDGPQTERVDFKAEQAPGTILAQVADGLDIKL